jgi:hypothetical protein
LKHPSPSNRRKWRFSLKEQAAQIKKSERADRDEQASGESGREQTLAIVHHNHGLIVCSLYEKDLCPFDVLLFCDDLCCQKQDSAAEAQLAQRKADLDTREKRLMKERKH